MVKPLDLLPEDKVLQKCRAALACAQAVLVFDRTSDVGSQESILVIQVKLREKVLGVGGGIAVVASVNIFRRSRYVAGHVRTGSMGNTHQAREEGQCVHRVDWGADAGQGEQEPKYGLTKKHRTVDDRSFIYMHGVSARR